MCFYLQQYLSSFLHRCLYLLDYRFLVYIGLIVQFSAARMRLGEVVCLHTFRLSKSLAFDDIIHVEHANSFKDIFIGNKFLPLHFKIDEVIVGRMHRAFAWEVSMNLMNIKVCSILQFHAYFKLCLEFQIRGIQVVELKNKYPGSKISDDTSTYNDINHRISAASKAFGSLQNTYIPHIIHKHAFIHVYV